MAAFVAIAGSAQAREPEAGHPRLYFTAGDLPALRAARRSGQHRLMWANLRESADWCLTLSPRKEWIAPVSPDPIYENLYDRFDAIMGDLAVTEHLAFAYALSGDDRYGRKARQWVLASCRVWQREADGAVDGSKAYAVCRLLKGLAVGYDVVYDLFSPQERDEIRATITRIGQRYYTDYFTTPTISGEGFSTHHAIVEWASFGVAALALLGEAPEAAEWLDATVTKFEKHLLPKGLAADGAQVEGPTFWASTMHYRLFFMDALRRVTGRDLFAPHRQCMNADLALAAVAAEKRPGFSNSHETVLLSPSYGQLDYYSPILLFLAREYRRPIYQYLALWDRTLGQINRTRYVTPHGEKLLFELGGYAYVWYDATVAADAAGEKLSYRFASVDEAYARASWAPGDLLVGVSGKLGLAVHAAGLPVLIELMDWASPPEGFPVRELADDGSTAVIRCGNGQDRSLTVEMHRADRRCVIRRRAPGEWAWWCQGKPVRKGESLVWDGARIEVTSGRIARFEPGGFAEEISVGYGKLKMADPARREFPRVVVQPSADGWIAVEIRCDGVGPATRGGE